MARSRKISDMPNTPAFSAYRVANQSVTTSTWEKVQCTTEEFDTASAYDAATNHRFTPQVAGYYLITGAVYGSGTNLTNCGAQIYKNGSSFKAGAVEVAGASSELNANVCALVYLNGSTDYVELWGYITGTGPEVTAGASLTYFQGVLVRAA